MITIYSAFAISQSLSYIDEAGNIHFVESLSEVPAKYRNQILKPTPPPTLSKKELRRLQKLKKKPTPKQAVRKSRTPKPPRTPRGKKNKQTPTKVPG
ncbi:MAG: hypothetical protein NZO16_02675 [Deltaproteobacteria bacterium]|nr:hypothetical protein [Deltaproteobacteria bacterium]